MFSPYYAWARRTGAAPAGEHVALNVALYGRGKRWSMTERGASAARREATRYAIGPSALSWDGNALTIDIDEIAAPLPRRIRGRVRVIPRALVTHTALLDTAGAHRWRPIAPTARVEVELTAPDLRWQGEAYFDSNEGDEPLERRLRRWHWSRGALREGTAVLYDVEQRDGARTALALRFDPRGEVQPFESPTPVALPRSGWRIERATRSQDAAAQLRRTLEDTPFYARSVVSQRLLGEAVEAVHESLDLDRFRAPIVQAMLPFRMPRRTRWP